MLCHEDHSIFSWHRKSSSSPRKATSGLSISAPIMSTSPVSSSSSNQHFVTTNLPSRQHSVSSRISRSSSTNSVASRPTDAANRMTFNPLSLHPPRWLNQAPAVLMPESDEEHQQPQHQQQEEGRFDGELAAFDFDFFGHDRTAGRPDAEAIYGGVGGGGDGFLKLDTAAGGGGAAAAASTTSTGQAEDDGYFSFSPVRNRSRYYHLGGRERREDYIMELDATPVGMGVMGRLEAASTPRAYAEEVSVGDEDAVVPRPRADDEASQVELYLKRGDWKRRGIVFDAERQDMEEQKFELGG